MACYITHAMRVAEQVLPTLRGPQKRQVERLLADARAADAACLAIPAREMHTDNPETMAALDRQQAASDALFAVINMLPIPVEG